MGILQYERIGAPDSNGSGAERLHPELSRTVWFLHPLASDSNQSSYFANLAHFRLIFAFPENEKTVFVSTPSEAALAWFSHLLLEHRKIHEKHALRVILLYRGPGKMKMVLPNRWSFSNVFFL
jgi:hypothetical protein